MKGGKKMTAYEKKKIAQLEKDIKKMQKDNKETFAEFDKKKSVFKRFSERFRKSK